MPTIDELIDKDVDKFSGKTSQAGALSAQYDIPRDQIDQSSGMSFGKRVDLSFAQDDEDKIHRFSGMYPEGVIAKVELDLFPNEDVPAPDRESLGMGSIERNARFPSVFVYKEDANSPDEKYKFLDPPGPDVGDIGDIVGPALPVVGIYAASGPGGPVTQGFRMGFGYMVGDIQRRSVNRILGTTRSIEDDLTDVTVDAGLNWLIGTGFGFAMKPLNVGKGAGGLEQTTATQGRIKEVKEARKAFAEDEGTQLVPLASFQQLTTNPVMKRLGQQAVSGSRSGQEMIAAQQESAVSAVEAMRNGQLSLEQLSAVIQQQARYVYRATVKNVRRRVTTGKLRKGDQAFQEANQAVINGTRGEVTAAYGVADHWAAKENPLFNLSEAQDFIKNTVLRGVRGVGKNYDQSIDDLIRSLGGEGTGPQGVNVADPIIGEFGAVLKDIMRLSPEQLDYNVLKTLRTRLFTTIDVMPWGRDRAIGLAEQTFGALSRSLNNPTNAAPGFRVAFAQATAQAAARFKVLRNEQLRAAIRQTSTTGELVARFGDPNRLDVDLMALLDKHAGKQIGAFKEASMARFLLEDGANTARLNSLKQNDKPLWKWLTGGNKRLQRDWAKAAGELDTLNASNIAQAAKNSTRGVQIIEALLARPGTIPSEMDAVLSSFGGWGSAGHTAMRQGAWELVLNRAVTYNSKGILELNTQGMGQIIREYKRNGVWRILDPSDRVKMQGLQSFTSLRAQTVGDAGTALEIASAVSQLKAPSTFVSGARELGANKVLAIALASKEADAILIGAGKRAHSGRRLILTFAIARALKEAGAVNDVAPFAEVVTK